MANKWPSKVRRSFVVVHRHWISAGRVWQLLLQLTKAKRESEARKLLPKRTLKTRNGIETRNKSCRLYCLQGPGGQCQRLKHGGTWDNREWWNCGKPKGTFIAQFLLTVDLQFPESSAFGGGGCCFQMEVEIWISM